MLPKEYRKITSPDLIKSKIKTWIIESESMHHRASATNHSIAQDATVFFVKTAMRNHLIAQIAIIDL